MYPRKRPQMPARAPGPRKPRSPTHYWHRPYWDDCCDWDDCYHAWDDYYDYYDYFDWTDYDYDYYYSEHRQPRRARPSKNGHYLKVTPMLMLNLLEYARTQAQSDTEIQTITDRMISMGGMMLDMDSYADIVGTKEMPAVAKPIAKPTPMPTTPGLGG